MTARKTIPDALKPELWAILGDYAAEVAMKIQATHGAPKRFVEAAHKILEMHRQLRPDQHGPRREPEPDFYGEIIEPPNEKLDKIEARIQEAEALIDLLMIKDCAHRELDDVRHQLRNLNAERDRLLEEGPTK